jgi:putative heme-binding domain-containing protein
MYGSPQRLLLLLDEIAAGRISPREIDPARAGQLRNHRDAGIRERAQALLRDDTDADRAKVLTDYQDALGTQSDPQRGREIFIKNCAQCHKVGDLGVNVAPDISDSRVKTAEQLLVSILDPNRAIDNNYFSFTVIDRDGVVHTGVIAAETATSVTLRQPEGKEITLLRSDIDELKSNGVSLMPVGLEKNITVEQMADLISFIKNWRYLDGSVPPEVIR